VRRKAYTEGKKAKADMPRLANGAVEKGRPANGKLRRAKSTWGSRGGRRGVYVNHRTRQGNKTETVQQIG